MTEATKRLSDAATKGIDARPRRHIPVSLRRSIAPSLLPPHSPSSLRRSVASSLLPPHSPSSLRRSVASSLPHAFTLVELIISIGLVLIIMLGVNFVFKMTSDTITAGQSLNEAVRNNRAAQSVVHDDFAKYAPDGPALLLRSQARLAFRNRIDQDSDRDYNESNTLAQRQAAISTIDYDGDNAYTSAGERATPAVPGQRSHRTDIFSFFGKGKFSRATGGDVGRNALGQPQIDPTAPLISDMSSNEAWIWYGHLVLPDNNGAFYIDPPTNNTKTNPGAGTASTNPNNFFASQWALGRLSHLLVEPYDHDGNSSTPNAIVDRQGGARQVYIGRGSSPQADSRGPFQWDSRAYSGEGSAQVTRADSSNIYLLDSRFDLIGSSIAGFRSILRNIDDNVTALSGFDWYGRMMLDVRFETNPALVRPVSAATVAAQAPIFMQGCTQFTVEFAGDFVAQNNDSTSGNYGYVTKAFNSTVPANNGTDGEIDFALTWNDANGNGNIDGNEQESVRKAIRWYGLPRDTTGDAVVKRPTSNANLSLSKTDVLPLRDLLTLVPGGQAADFEKDLAADLPTRSDYANPTSGMAFDDRYTCAWGPNDVVRPRMIRITMVVDDPTGRLPDGQTYEYVFSLPPAE